MQTCEICGEDFPDDRKVFGRHLWEEHSITPNDYRVQFLGTAPQCARPGCSNPVRRHPDGGWFKHCSSACAIEMGGDIPLPAGGLRGDSVGDSTSFEDEIASLDAGIATLERLNAEMDALERTYGMPSFRDPENPPMPNLAAISGWYRIPMWVVTVVLILGGWVATAGLLAEEAEFATIAALFFGLFGGALIGGAFLFVMGWVYWIGYWLRYEHPLACALIVIVFAAGTAGGWYYFDRGQTINRAVAFLGDVWRAVVPQ